MEGWPVRRNGRPGGEKKRWRTGPSLTELAVGFVVFSSPTIVAAKSPIRKENLTKRPPTLVAFVVLALMLVFVAGLPPQPDTPTALAPPPSKSR
jgi:hypothetical protein